MAQIFHPSTNTLSRVSLVSLIVVPGLLLAVGSSITRSPANTHVAVPLEQPVPFSHEHHNVELGIDCRYCHTSVEKAGYSNVPPTETCMSCHSQIWTNSPLLEPVRQSYRTGEPLRWSRLNKVPDFVYFNHSIHIAKGINCNNCHGPIQKMQLAYKGKAFFMAWCLECHRAPEKYIGKKEEVFNIYERYQRGEVTAKGEVALMNGFPYNRTPEELDEGRRLVKEYNVKVQQLADCWTCHH